MTTTTISRTPVAGTWQINAWRFGIGAGIILIGVALSTSVIGRLIAIAIAFTLSMTWSVQRVLIALLVMFLAVDNPSTAPFDGLWESPVQEVGGFFFNTIGSSVPFVPIPVAPMVLLSVIQVARVATERTGPRMTREPRKFDLPHWFGGALMLAAVSIPLLAIWGAATGGNTQQVYYQSYGVMLALSLTAATGAVVSPAFAQLAWRIVMIAAIYRGALAIWIYWTIARGIEGDPPLYLTTHGDSILWVLALVYVASELVERADSRSRWHFALLAPYLGIAIIVNNRRLAWVIAAAGLAYVVVSTSRVASKRLRKISGIAVPVLGAYTLAGLVAPPARMFAPVQALESVVTGEDSSSITRDIEDFNLIATARSTFPLPRGFGHEYIEFVAADDISAAFPQFRYLPHNSVLGMLLLVGPVVLMIMLAPLVLSAHASHRLRRASIRPDVRTTTAMVMASWIAFVAQAWGDLGLFSPTPTATVGITSGIGLGLYSWYRHYGGLDQVLQ